LNQEKPTVSAPPEDFEQLENEATADLPSLQSHWRSLLMAFAVSFAVAGIGSSLTVLDGWYFALKQPAWKPPDAAFGVIWSVIFSLSAISAWLGWHALSSAKLRRKWLILWGFNAFFNVFWSLIYFKWHRPDWSLVELVFIWLSVVVLMVFIYPHRRRAAWLLLPYLVWVTTAGFLNNATIVLNGPFA